MPREFSDRVCCVCARPATGMGFAPKGARSVSHIAWTCDDRECLEIARDSYSMKQTEFSRLDHLATLDAGGAGGEYLDKIGKSDLASLTEEEWQGFLIAIVGGYRAALKGRLRDEAPF